MASRYITWTVAQLKKELMQRDAATHGRKTDLIQRYVLVMDIFTSVSLKILQAKLKTTLIHVRKSAHNKSVGKPCH